MSEASLLTSKLAVISNAFTLEKVSKQIILIKTIILNLLYYIYFFYFLNFFEIFKIEIQKKL